MIVLAPDTPLDVALPIAELATCRGEEVEIDAGRSDGLVLIHELCKAGILIGKRSRLEDGSPPSAMYDKKGCLTHVRTLQVGEALPTELDVGFEHAHLEPRWVWVYEDEGRIVGCVVAAPCHGIVHLLVVRATAEAPKDWLLITLRQAIVDVKERGYTGVMVFIEVGRPIDLKLAKLAERFGLKAINRIGFWCAGRL